MICTSEVKFFHHLRTNFVAGGGAGLLVLSILAFLNPPASATTTKTLNLTASVKDAISLALSSNSLNLDLTPTPNGVFRTGTFDATVSTSNSTGYTLYVASTGLDHNGEVTSNLIHSSPDVSSDSVISPLEGAVVVSRSGDTYTDTSAFGNDKWGLSTDATTFKPVSITNNIFDSYEENTNDRITNFTFGTKVDTNIVAGTYSNTLTITAIANPVYRTFTINYALDGGTSTDPDLKVDTETGNYVYIASIADEYYPEVAISSVTPTKTGYTFQGYATSLDDQAAGTVTYQPGGKVPMDYESPSVSLYAVWKINSYTLTVVPNGGTWSGSTSNQQFTQNYGTTKSIANPSAAYSISYNANGQGASYSASPTSVARNFTGWTNSGSGSWNSSTKVYTYGAGNGTLTANYNGTSNSFTLPGISRSGYTCVWRQGSASGTARSGGSSLTITGNTTFYASCTINDPCPSKYSGSTKLADGKCWRYMSSGANWSTANSTCSGIGMHLPSSTEWSNYKGVTSWSGNFWSSTNFGGNVYGVYNVSSSSASVGGGNADVSYQVACTASP